MVPTRRTVLSGLVIAVAGCHAGPTDLTIDNRETYWETHGFVELVPALRPPTTPDGRDQVRVWLKLPEGARLTTVGTSLRVPDGAVADRVETLGTGGVDVRGTRFGEGGVEMFHVFHSDAMTPGAPVSGIEWRRGDATQQTAATKKLVASLRGQPDREIEMLRQFNECTQCHDHDRPPAARASTWGPRRATDGSGLYELLATLGDAAPLEINRPRDANAEDRFVTAWCGAEPAALSSWPTGARRFECRDGTVPIGRLDTVAARAASDPHALAVCRSRRFLFDHMSDAARVPFRSGFASCGF